jgi:fumarate reductase subunit D
LRRRVVIWLIKFAMCTMMPRSDALPGIGDTDLDGFLRKMKRDADPLYWLGLAVGAVVFAVSPLLTVYLPVPAFFLPHGLLEKHCERILSSRIYLLRQAVFLVRLSAGMCWGADEKVRALFALAPYPPDPGTFRPSSREGA